jgi:hypothetical protein
MKIKECVVIDSWLFNRLIEELNNSDNDDLACTLRIESKPLEPIIRDAYNAGNDWNEDIEGYLNNKEI